MTEWYAAFGSVRPPAMHFLISLGGKDSSSLYFCEPPNTVYEIGISMAIGQGARPVEPMLEDLFWPNPKPSSRSALLSLAYLMHVAKSQEGSACGGKTTTVVITQRGTFTFVSDEEMTRAEEFAEKVHGFLDKVRQALLRPSSEEEPNLALGRLSKAYADLKDEELSLTFPSLAQLEKGWWERKQSKQLAAQKSEPEP
jgi:hypothetical protein